MPGDFLVQYGKPAYLGRFTTPGHEFHARGDRVVISGPRGCEIGVVLCEPQARFANVSADGELNRAVTIDDDSAHDAAGLRALELLALARSRVERLGLPMEAVDAEVSLDGRTAILHGLAWSDCDAGPLLEELSATFGLIVRFLDLARTAGSPAEPEGCGKPGCGSGGGGCTSCSTGGGCSSKACSSGKVKDADELTAYFADLRRQMELASAGRTPLV